MTAFVIWKCTLRHLISCAVIVLAGCQTPATDYVATGAPDTRRMDYAECSILARQVASGYEDIGALLARNRTLDECMTAKGYEKQ